MPKVIKVKALENYRLLLDFDNGEIREFDVSPYLHGEFMGALSNVNYFNQVKVGEISVEWPGGQDLCPDDIYENSVLVR